MIVGARNSSAANNSASFQDSENHCCRLPNLPRLLATATLMSENYWRNQKKMEKEKKMLVFSQFSQGPSRLFRCLFPLTIQICSRGKISFYTEFKIERNYATIEGNLKSDKKV